MTESRPPEVLIVGATATGLFLACDLLRRGIRVRLIEGEPAEGDEWVVLQPRALEVLRSIGIGDALLAQGHRLRGARFFVDREELLTLDFGDLADTTAFPFQLHVRRRAVESCLEARLGELGGQVERVAFSLSETGQAYVVGSDGPGEQVRTAAGIGLRESGPRQDFSWTPVEGDLSDGQSLGVCPEGFGALIPTGDGTGLLLTSGSTDRAAALARKALPSVRLAGPTISAPSVTHGLAARYRAGSTFLCGSAAWVPAPAGGQGVSAGIQDAWNLGWKLALVLKGQADERLLESYEAERRPTAEFFGAVLDRLFEQASQPGLLMGVLRKTVVPGLARTVRKDDRLKRLVSLVLSNLGVQYRQSPFVEGDRDQEPAPGDRVPPGLFGGGDKHAGFRLVLPGAPEKLVDAARQELERHVPGLILVTAAPGPAPAQLLVRPDGYVSWRASGWDMNGLIRHLKDSLGVRMELESRLFI